MPQNPYVGARIWVCHVFVDFHHQQGTIFDEKRIIGGFIMRTNKKLAIFIFAVVMLISTLVLPASATLHEPYYGHVCDFNELYNGSPDNAYIRAVQCFLYHFPDTSDIIEQAGGIDGGYGNGTESAVRIYQASKWSNDPTQQDGRVGPKTWEKIAGDLVDAYPEPDLVALRYRGADIMHVDTRAEGYRYYNCDEWGNRDRFIVQH